MRCGRLGYHQINDSLPMILIWTKKMLREKKNEELRFEIKIVRKKSKYFIKNYVSYSQTQHVASNDVAMEFGIRYFLLFFFWQSFSFDCVRFQRIFFLQQRSITRKSACMWYIIKKKFRSFIMNLLQYSSKIGFNYWINGHHLTVHDFVIYIISCNFFFFWINELRLL